MKAKLDRTTKKIILMMGREYEPATLPADIARGTEGNCFDWCALQTAKLFPKYHYVEGIATNPENPKEWVLHAWMTDGIYAFDPTWQAINDAGEQRPLPSAYYGVAFNMMDVRDFMAKTGYQGIFANRHRDIELWKAIKKRIKRGMRYGQTA